MYVAEWSASALLESSLGLYSPMGREIVCNGDIFIRCFPSMASGIMNTHSLVVTAGLTSVVECWSSYEIGTRDRD